jgi:ribonuclease E
MQEAEAREEEEEEEREAARYERGGAPREQAEAPELHVPDEPIHDAEASEAAAASDAVAEASDAIPTDTDAAPESTAAEAEPDQPPAAQPAAIAQDIIVAPVVADAEIVEGSDLAPEVVEPSSEAGETPILAEAPETSELPIAADPDHNDTDADPALHEEPLADDDSSHHEVIPPNAAPEHIGGELDVDDRPDRRQPSRFLRNYKIQEVMRRRQILLVQVVKEERGTKGAALTTYISLAGRFSVLMPNSPRGGGISRKITSAADRRRLKEITSELELPRGMGLIVRTAGAARPKPEILRDCEYLLNQWDQIRELTMKSMAPALIYEEASLIKRAIRDVYSRDVEEILVDGEQGWRAARDFMRMLMPAHAKKVQLWRDPQPLFAKAQVESQLDAMLQPTVQLRSGGYLVINQTEALVAIDVNSGRSTRERGIEETAVRTNLEAAEEAARQLRLRDLAGLIVIDFIDMESRRNNTAVEKRLKDALKNDRARIQVGSISHFGLLEMSRQRLRPSIAETNSVPCPHCGGTGHMRSTESAALAVLRAIEEEGGRLRSAEIVVHVHGSIALYVLNHKRVRLAEIEQRFGLHVVFQADDGLIPPQNRIERVRALLPSEVPEPIAQLAPADAGESMDEAVMEAEDIDADMGDAAPQDEMESDEPEAVAKPGETAEETEQRQRKRRRRRRGGRRDDASVPVAIAAPIPSDEGVVEGEVAAEPAGEMVAEAVASPVEGETVETAPPADGFAEGERKRRGRRGGRRRRREPGAGDAPVAEGEEVGAEGEPEAEAYVQPYVAPYTPSYVPTYTGPTPANPFGGDSNAFAFFDAVEEIDTPPPAPRPAPAPAPAPIPAPIPAPVIVAEVEPVVAPAPEPEVVVAAPEPVAVIPEPEPAPSGPVIGPAIVPIVVGAPDAPPVEKKKGWWRK